MSWPHANPATPHSSTHPELSCFSPSQVSATPQIPPDLRDPYLYQRHGPNNQQPPDPTMLSNAVINARHSETPPDPALPRKRKRTEYSENAGSRVPIACRACRDRKTRCSGDQPSCSYCRKVNIECVYGQGLGGYIAPRYATPSGLDEWGNKILTAIGELAETLESTGSNRIALSPAVGLGSETLKPNFLNGSGIQAIRGSQIPTHDIRSVKSILACKVFSNKIDSSVRASVLAESVAKIIKSPNQGHASGSTSKADLMKLRDSFVTFVLPTIPVLSVPQLDGYISYIGENGAEWSSKSCLVFLVAALGIASQQHVHGGMENEIAREASHVQTKTNEAAFWYWNMAKKRLGWALEDDGLVAAQCLCLAGIWHLLSYEPLAAWKMFQNASLSLARGPNSLCEDIEGRRLKDDIRWICCKYQFKLQPHLEIPMNGAISLEQLVFLTTESNDNYDYLSAQISLLKLNRAISQNCEALSIELTLPEILNLSSKLSPVQQQLEAWLKSQNLATTFALSCKNGDYSILPADRGLRALHQSYLEAKELSLRIWTYLYICTDLADIIHSSGEQFIREHFFADCCKKSSSHLESVILRLKTELDNFKYAKPLHESYFVIQDCFALTLLLLAARNQTSRSTSAVAGVNMPENWTETVNDVITSLEAADMRSMGKEYARVLRLL